MRPKRVISVIKTGRIKAFERAKTWLAPINQSEVCPICGGTTSKEFRFGPAEFVTGPSSSIPEVQGHTKYRCMRCGHLYTNWLAGDLQRTSEIYRGIYSSDQLHTENARAPEEMVLFHYMIRMLGSPAGARLLDFGCGPNQSATLKLRAEGHDAHCCDILDSYKYDGAIFFQYDLDPGRWTRYFDGIVSTEVIEHLSDTMDTWTYFNRILRPGGFMAHCFPSQHHYTLSHSDVKNPFHVCLFSPESLNVLIEKTGFALRKIGRVDSVGRHVFLFEKVMEIRPR